jgi:hypothetical protein
MASKKIFEFCAGGSYYGAPFPTCKKKKNLKKKKKRHRHLAVKFGTILQNFSPSKLPGGAGVAAGPSWCFFFFF